MRAGIAIAFAVLVLAGCGNGGIPGTPSSLSIDKSKLEENIKTKVDDFLAGDGTTDVSCVEEEDDFHFTCLAQVVGGSKDGTVQTYKASCDRSNNGTCIWRAE